MSVDSCFEIPEDERIDYIDRKIVAKLPGDVKASAKERATLIVNNYIGLDANALSVLAYAAERDRFNEFAGKLEQYYHENIDFIDPEIRLLGGLPIMRRVGIFFIQCYKELGIQDRYA